LVRPWCSSFFEYVRILRIRPSFTSHFDSTQFQFGGKVGLAFPIDLGTRTTFIVALDDIRAEEFASGTAADELIDGRGAPEARLLAIEKRECLDRRK